jgi:hypothetical protein
VPDAVASKAPPPHEPDRGLTERLQEYLYICMLLRVLVHIASGGLDKSGCGVTFPRVNIPCGVCSWIIAKCMELPSAWSRRN